MAAIAQITIIDQAWLNKNRNQKIDDPFSARLQKYAGETRGTSRMLDVVRKSIRLGNQTAREVGIGFSRRAAQFDSNLGVGASAIGLAGLPSATLGAMKSLSELTQKDDGVPLTRKVAKAFRNTLQTMAGYGFAAFFIIANPAMGAGAQLFSLASKFASFHLTSEDYTKSFRLEAAATGEAKIALSHSRHYYFLSVARDIIAIATAVLGLTLAMTGLEILPTIGFVALSLCGSLVAIQKDFYKDAGKYKVVPFDREVAII